MKKIYLIVFSITISILSFGQTPIVTIDRDNIVGPTTTGTAANISSIGLTRGTGVNQRNGTDFSTRDWDGTSKATAESNNDYLEWSVSANVNYDIEITEIDIRLRRNPNGPVNWQLFYSTDNFASTSTPVNGVETLVADTNVVYNFNGLSINSGTSGTITYRLYAWNATTNGGWLRVRRLAAWSEFGIDLPGIRLTGNITTSSSNSSESNIITTVSFDPTDNLDYSLYNATSGLTTVNSLKVGEFTIQDGGDDLTDSDTLDTILNDIEFTVVGAPNIVALAIFDGSLNVSETTSISSTTSFLNINSGSGLTALDGDIKTFDVYATFNSTVTDNEQLQLTISAAIPDGTGSTFEASAAGGASTSIAGDDNRIEVTATVLVFDQQPSNLNQLEIMTPFPVVNSVDSNNNLDLDFSGLVDVISSGSLDPSSINYNVNNGIGVFDTIKFSQQGANITLVVLSAELGGLLSSSFDVLGPIVTVAIQDFDSTSPEWAYTNDTPFFDNGWGIDGYYGIIDKTAASPLDYAYFGNNILGENDLNDEGDNGTNGWAAIQFDDVDISSFSNVEVRFDWQVIGYANNNDNAQYQLFYDGVGQGRVFIFDGDNGSSINDGSGSIVLNIPDVVNAVSLELRIRNNGNNGYSGFDNFKVVSVFDGLLYTNNAWTPIPPSDATGSEDVFVKDGNYIVGSVVEVNNLFIENGATVSIAPAESMLINNNIVTDGLLELNSVSTTYSSLIVVGNVEGLVTYNRHVNTNASSGGNDLISAPVTGETFGDFAGNNSNIVSNPSNPNEKLFGPFDKTTGLYLTYDTTVPTEASVTLDPGIGYRAASTDGLNFSFIGAVNTSIVDVPIVISGPNNPEWNLIGNPYPSYITLSDFLDTNNALFDTVSSGIYGYDGNASDGWEIWNQAYSEANPSAVITPGQGFLVASGSASETISFTPSMRSIGTTDDFIPGRVMNPSISNLELTLTKEDTSYKTDFYFTENASQGLDPGYDSQTFGGVTPEFSIYSHLVAENSGISMAIQSVSNSDLSNVTIPIGINSLQGEQVSVSISNSTLPVSIEVYLEDNVTNTITLLTDNNYQFTPSSNINGTGRFFLRFVDASLTVDELALNNLHVYATLTPKTLFIKGLLNSNTSVKIYDLQSRLVLTTNLNTSSDSNQVDLSNLVTGVYMVSISNNAMTKTQKIIVK
ncbi:T9SS type A sorting domain-containing protein [Oceanihabitans sp.]|nr:T9SS type A sorting domain-containing protein [Oceanihabitans sp.]